jgi:hypothetical protein
MKNQGRVFGEIKLTDMNASCIGEVLWWGRKSNQGRFSLAARAWEDLSPPGVVDASRKFKAIAAGNDASMGISGMSKWFYSARQI